MENPNKETITETVVFNQEANPNSCTTEVVDNSPEIISENIEPTSSNVLTDIKLSDEQPSNAVAHNNYLETNSENVDFHSNEVSTDNNAGDLEVNKSDNTEIIAQTETVSETTTVTEKYEEYVSISQHEEKDGQSTEYVSRYVLEENTDSVYISDVQDENLDSSGQVHSEAVSSDENQLNEVPDQVIQQNVIVSTESNEHKLSETSVVSEYSADQADAENWPQLGPQLEPAPENQDENQSDKNIPKHLNLKDNIKFVDDVETQNTVDSDRNEKSGQENLMSANENEMLVGDISENMEEPPKDSEDKCEYNVKQETHFTDIDDDDRNKEQEIRNVNDLINESSAHDQVICSNDEIIENVDIPDEPAVSSESISVESYTLAEGMEVTEIQDGEYTIVEGPSSLDITANQLDESGHSGETWVLLSNNENSEDSQLETVADEQNEMYLSEVRSEAESRQSVNSQTSDIKPRRGRKPTYDIPMHVLGHDISKPMETVPNGRSLPKPRLGVKVPYRNLTSQIVSKAEIEKEVMERARLKQEQVSSRADVIFARKLTQRLARKIAPSPDPPKKPVETRKSKEGSAQIQRKETETVPEDRSEIENSQSQDNSKIHNDSDLLAILEGEGEEMPVLPKEVPLPVEVDDSNLKMLEREIALQQLQELPHQAPKHRIYRGRQIKTDGKAPVLIPEASISKSKSSNKSDDGANQSPISNQKAKDDQPANVLSDKENETVRQSVPKDVPSASPPKKDQSNAEILSSPKKQPIEIEPQVKVNMVLKTYSRKRKTIELPDALIDSPLPKKTMLAESEIKLEKPDTPAPTNVYVTKSSRVIKKKVIWDPDETPTRSPKSVTKTDVQSPKTVAIKTAKIVEKVPNLEQIPEKKPVSEKLVKEKLEKKSIEKISSKKRTASPNERKVIVLKSDVSKGDISKSDVLKGKTPVKSKKLRSEVDKLLMDEGAVKMLYDLKNNEESVPKKKKDVYSVEKAHKEIMKKANEIKSDLQQNTSNESPKSLRKKESFTPSPLKPAQITYNTERKMSKDSTRSSLHTPPGSPAYSFPHGQSSMLVRRRSSSSISSSDEVVESDISKTSRKKLTSSETPKIKKIKKNDSNEESQKLSEVKDPPEKPALVENKLSSYKSFTIKRINKHITIDLNYVDENCYCTAQVLEELTTALKKFAKEKDCHIVSITSNSKAFCLGLDYTSLISDKEDVRKEVATQLAEKVREFLLCLLKFPKVLIAGIQGECAGLGVTMLPLFDMVIASDTATFSTPYASLGCVAEAGFLLSPPIFTNHGLASELLYNTHKLTADDVFRRGLVTRLCWPEKYNETLKQVMISISRGSKQSLVATKKQLRRHLVQTTEAAINSETKVLVEHWISSECQKNFSQINGGTAE
ncbi:uncharacterized protein LOC108915435 [Anoplophora glabripennis]|nr:uncharacterized protein LOC108915435 [Anoplophora glabripennis]